MARPRKFDHDEAARLRRSGVTIKRAAEILGVSQFSIERATNPKSRENQARRQRERRSWMTTCIDCGAPAAKPRNYRGRHGRCRACASKAKATSVRPDTLRCGCCRLWLPDDEFSPKPSSSPLRRGRDSRCKPCANQVRRDNRLAAKATS